MNYTELRKLMASPEEKQKIIDQTLFLGIGTIPMQQRLFHIDNKLYIIPLCKTCNISQVKWSIKNLKYSTYCCSKCAHSDPIVTSKREDTCLLKYGHTTNLKADSNKQKQRDTLLEKYGVDNFAKSAEFTEKFKNTCLTRYGVTNPSKLSSVQDKIDVTHMNRYGRKRSSQVHIPLDIISLKDDPAIMKYWFQTMQMPVTEIAELLGINHSQLCVHFKKNLGIDITRHSVSLIERQVGEYLTSNGIIYEISNRTLIGPKELDIFVPSFNLAIEINGLAWHTERRGKDKNYHLNKTIKCKAQGIRLIHILDSEWLLTPELVKSRLLTIFNKHKKLYARKCNLIKLTKQESTQFFNETHIQKSCASLITYGLEYNGEIVACMSFGKSRFNKKYQWELLRFSNKLGISVVGGAGRLFSHFIKEHTPNSIVSYCDLRWNTGSMYTSIGFIQTRVSSPNYWYTKDYRIIFNRMQFQKHVLSRKLAIFDPLLTEWENMAANGYDRIWDCGNAVFEWHENTALLMIC